MANIAVRPTTKPGALSIDDMFGQFDGFSPFAPNLLAGEVVNYDFAAGFNVLDTSVTTTPTNFGDVVQRDTSAETFDGSETATLQKGSIFASWSSTDAQSSSTEVYVPKLDYSYGNGDYAVVSANYTIYESFDPKGNPDYLFRDVGMSQDHGSYSWFQSGQIYGSASMYYRMEFEQVNAAWKGGESEYDHLRVYTSNWDSVSGPDFYVGSGQYSSVGYTHNQSVGRDDAGHQVSAFEYTQTTSDRGSSSQFQWGNFSGGSWENRSVETDTMKSVWGSGAFAQDHQLVMSSEGSYVSGKNFDVSSSQYVGRENTHIESVTKGEDGVVQATLTDDIARYFGGSQEFFNFKTPAGDFSGTVSAQFSRTIETVDTWSADGMATHQTFLSAMASFDTTFSSPGAVSSHHEGSYSNDSTMITIAGQTPIDHSSLLMA